MNALDVAHSFVETGRARRVLVASGEVLSGTVNRVIEDGRDLTHKFAALTLGDGGGACVVEAATAETEARLHRGVFLSDGRHWPAAVVLGGGSVRRRGAQARYFESDSAALARVAGHYVPKVIEKALAGVGWDVDDIDLVVPHQVSLEFTDFLASEMGFDPSRVLVTLDRVGNTAAASIPMALSIANEEGRLRPGHNVLLVGAAGGFSAAAVPLTW